MSGIIFFKTRKLEDIKSFYINEVGCTIWMDQRDCIILQHDNLLLGFCQRESVDTMGMITFYYEEKTQVDIMYDKFRAISDESPRDNPKYPIYHFFCKDPEGRILEFQYFYNFQTLSS